MDEWKDAFNSAIKKTLYAWNKAEESISNEDSNGFKEWHKKFCRYVEIFSKAANIPEKEFIRIVNEKKSQK